MADFKEAFKHLAILEGGYVSHNTDRGGETYRGISRNWNPKWVGWEIIDAVKLDITILKTKDKKGYYKELDCLLAKNENLNGYVDRFYKTLYWQRLAGNSISDQKIADTLLIIAVHASAPFAVKALQVSLNTFSEQDELIVDGWLGEKTRTKLGVEISYGHRSEILYWMNVAYGHRLLNLVTKDKTQRVFTVGWAKRAGSILN